MTYNNHQPLLLGGIYHLFSRAVGNEKLFLSEENYFFFLCKLREHIEGVSELFCYSLLPNHFHLFVKISDSDRIAEKYKLVKRKEFAAIDSNLSDFIMERFSNFLNGYTKAFNKMYSRKGALFMDYLKRSLADDDSAFTSFIFYIHKNAIHHGLTKQIGD